MKRIKIGIALISLSGLLLGTANIAIAKTTSPVNHAKVSHTSTKSTHHQAKSVHKLSAATKLTAKHITKHT